MASTNSATLSIRAAAREYGLARSTIADNLAEIPHRKIAPRRVVILRAAFEEWLRGETVRPSSHAEQIVNERLEREAAHGGPP